MSVSPIGLMVQIKCCKSSVFRINNNSKPYDGTGHEKNLDFENVGVHVNYIGGRIKGLKNRRNSAEIGVVGIPAVPLSSQLSH